jgi:hypothetical protein
MNGDVLHLSIVTASISFAVSETKLFRPLGDARGHVPSKDCRQSAVQRLLNAGVTQGIFDISNPNAGYGRSAGGPGNRVAKTSESTVKMQSKPEEAKEKEPTFKGCSKEKKDLILKGVEGAKKLADKALKALKRDIPMSWEEKAFKGHFGSVSGDQKKTIISRFENIQATLGMKEIVCTPKCKGKGGTDLCAWAETPGSRIFISPNFGTASCDPGQTILHEASHNAGAKKDVDKDGGYPPKDSEKNAYSYEYFPVDVAKGPPKVELPPKKEIEIKIPGE